MSPFLDLLILLLSVFSLIVTSFNCIACLQMMVPFTLTRNLLMHVSIRVLFQLPPQLSEGLQLLRL